MQKIDLVSCLASSHLRTFLYCCIMKIGQRILFYEYLICFLLTIKMKNWLQIFRQRQSKNSWGQCWQYSTHNLKKNVYCYSLYFAFLTYHLYIEFITCRQSICSRILLWYLQSIVAEQSPCVCLQPGMDPDESWCCGSHPHLPPGDPAGENFRCFFKGPIFFTKQYHSASVTCFSWRLSVWMAIRQRYFCYGAEEMAHSSVKSICTC